MERTIDVHSPDSAHCSHKTLVLLIGNSICVWKP